MFKVQAIRVSRVNMRSLEPPMRAFGASDATGFGTTVLSTVLYMYPTNTAPHELSQ